MAMRVYRFDALTGIDDLTPHDEQMPEPQRGEVVVRVRAVSLNYRDIAPALGRYVWEARPNLIPCSDAAGDVVAIGDGVSAYKTGDRVISTFHPRWFGGRAPATAMSETYGTGQDGWLCGFKAVSQEAIVRLPSVNKSLDAVRWGGEVVLIGFLSDKGPGIDYFHLKGSGALVRAIGVGDRAMLEDLVSAIDATKIKPVIDTMFDFADAKNAFRHLHEGNQIGKIVIRLG
jgi:NADPH:quinone reductase-like Zn-dependent oxidoreductase